MDVKWLTLIVVDGEVSNWKVLCGVPQGSVLAPILFLLYDTSQVTQHCIGKKAATSRDYDSAVPSQALVGQCQWQ